MPAGLTFLLSATVVAWAGIRLARDGDVIAHGTGLGGAWVGAILVAAATSLPELTTDVNAVLLGAPDLAVGDLFGSCMANLLILAIADQATRHPRMLTRVTVNQALVGTLGSVLILTAILGIVARDVLPVLPVGPAVLAVGVVYVLGLRLLHQNRAGPPFRSRDEVEEARPATRELRRAGIGFLVAAGVIFVAAPFLASSAADLAAAWGVSQSFVGILALSITTSLPEAAVTLGSVRLGAYDLAVGNLLGSNCFNMMALVPLDLVNGPESLLAVVDPRLVVGGLAAALMTGIALMDVLSKAERRFWRVEPGPAAMILVYLAGLYVVYASGG